MTASTSTPPARLRPEHALEAAGYIRVSLERQAQGQSPDMQREAIKHLAVQQGYALTLIEEDHERGSNISREGYQRIIEAVQRGTVHAVLVYMFDRWGRDGIEWLTRAREFERLGVPIISVQEGKDEGGLMRFMRAGMAEEYSRQLAKRVRDAKESGARKGMYTGPTPVGYKRVYPTYVAGTGQRPAGELVPDEATAWMVRELYDRYAAGGWSSRTLATWLNTDPRCPRPRRGVAWTGVHVTGILGNPLYRGAIRYNKDPRGIYARAAPGSMFVAPGQHPPLVSPDLWETVQRRRAVARGRPTYNRPVGAPGRRVRLASGLLTCAGCGGAMYYAHDAIASLYVCYNRAQGVGDCRERSYKAELAHGALLAAVRSVRGAPWTPQGERRLLGAEDGQSPRAAAQAATLRALEAEREQLRKHTLLMSMMADDPTPEQVIAFREVSAQVSARIRALEAQLSSSTEKAAQLPRLRELHTTLTQTEIPAVLGRLHAQGDEAAQRALVVELVSSARLVERLPASHPTWARVEVTWTDEVQTLLDAGLLRLDAPAPPPVFPTPAQMHAARMRRWRARRKERSS